MDPNHSRASLSSDKHARPEPDSTSTASDSRIRDHLTILTPNGLPRVLKRLRTWLQAPSLSPSFLGKNKKSIELSTLTSVGHGDPRHPEPPIPRPKNILDLPSELQLMIIEYLHFGDIVRLRQTCKRYRALTSPTQMRALFGPVNLRYEILGHCKVCLTRDLEGTFERRGINQLLSVPTDVGYPFSTVCIKCAFAANDRRLRVGQLVKLGNHGTAWICRWCGWPILEMIYSSGDPYFHRKCDWHFGGAMQRFVVLGCMQFAVGVVAASFSWRYFRHRALAFAPSLTYFLLHWVSMLYMITQPLRRYCYFIFLFLELAMVGCWIPPVYYVSAGIAAHPPGEAVPRTTVASLVLFCLVLIFRLINIIGDVVIVSGYNLARRKRPQVSRGRRLTYPVMLWLVTWTYPPSVGNSGSRIGEAHEPFTFHRQR